MRIGGCGEGAFLNFRISFADFFLFVFQQLFELGFVLSDGFCLGSVVEGKQVGIGNPEDN